MRVVTIGVAAAFALLSCAEGFQSSVLSASRSESKVVAYGYVPNGFTKESWAKFQEKEKQKKSKANLGRLGPKGFQSRSMQAFQEAMERGETTHLLPVMNAKERVAKGELRPEDIPYMQRGGSWDNSDIKGAKKMRWGQKDKEYEGGGFKKEQSVSIFGYGEGLDWTGSKSRKGPEGVMAAAPKFEKNYKAPNINDLKKDDTPKKKWFGMF
uniref:Uncharacterized protein n=1 Tax=Trieres chinensis TaxID=1514140 RepID=A0A7S2A9I5_TRICV|mmetsp:Transcript_7914/g.16753  ORF Transcript_7914/g.16753 Transcript_7914/m.16753 type:complete len:211 (+) Transcript_7914:75-707(+)|eukprot:CAMPEP_0183292972 /NCGR_PEP_ID=MMETSP0160_2-20130417/1840_1 /TAXON_ID=2839 ORGANISM="Odontella Sinensis, Strain Grunow 1884" /NCGR_SAMPLE_ID=MMETSP0160_2 /ASSEMBLY_ACC=CAM_ASM_000250 /LENGTH=210 /DNA_ID=CAMNT_0025454023 /DNA_START=60 /DNA_END=692 /DNA_ORIENTATION=+